MHILCVFDQSAWIHSHIPPSLRAAGHNVHIFTYGNYVGEFYGLSRYGERRTKNRALIETARDLKRNNTLDMIFCYVYDDFLLPETASALSSLNIPLVNYNVDMINQWYRQIRTARFFTKMLCAQRDNMQLLSRYNPRVLYFPMAGKVSPSTSIQENKFAPAAPVTFLGTPNAHRTAVLSRLHRAGIPLAIYGKDWLEKHKTQHIPSFEKTLHDIYHYSLPKLRAEGLKGLINAFARRFTFSSTNSGANLPDSILHGILSESNIDVLFRTSSINLGFARMIGDNPDLPGKTQIKLRDFEVPLAGGFYLVERVKEYEEHFIPGVEVETWKTVDELIAKIQYYLDHPEERQRIAAAGKKRATGDHTWGKRFSMLLRELGIA